MYFPERADLLSIPLEELTLAEWLSVIAQQKSLLNLFEESRDDSVRITKSKLNGGENEVSQHLLNSLNKQKRTYSEMPLCEIVRKLALNLGYTLPKGFSYEGNLATGSPDITFGEPHSVSHLFFIRPTYSPNREEDLVGCLTPGQFVKPFDKTLAPGDRINILQERAAKLGLPGLVHQVNNQITLLLGTRKQLQMLGFTYHDQHRRR